MSRGRSLEHDVYVRPRPEAVALLIDGGYGLAAARERWPWCEERTLLFLAAEGRRAMGLPVAARGAHHRSSTTPEQEAAVVDAVERLASVPAAAASMGLDHSVVRRILRDHGLPIPRVDRRAAALKAAEARRQRRAA